MIKRIAEIGFLVSFTALIICVTVMYISSRMSDGIWPGM